MNLPIKQIGLWEEHGANEMTSPFIEVPNEQKGSIICCETIFAVPIKSINKYGLKPTPRFINIQDVHFYYLEDRKTIFYITEQYDTHGVWYQLFTNGGEKENELLTLLNVPKPEKSIGDFVKVEYVFNENHPIYPSAMPVLCYSSAVYEKLLMLTTNFILEEIYQHPEVVDKHGKQVPFKISTHSRNAFAENTVEIIMENNRLYESYQTTIRKNQKIVASLLVDLVTETIWNMRAASLS